jgi:flagellar biosynthesis component FlhA
MRFAFSWLQEHWSDVAFLILTLLGIVFAIFPTKLAELEKRPWTWLWKFGLSAVLIFIGLTGTLQGISKATKAETDTQQARAEEKQAREEQREDAKNNKASQQAMQDKLDKVLGNPNAPRRQKQEAATLKQEITDLKTKQDKNLGIRNKLAHFLRVIPAPEPIGPTVMGVQIVLSSMLYPRKMPGVI